MTVDRPSPPILVIHGAGQLGWDVEVSLLDTGDDLHPLERQAIPRTGDDLVSLVAQIAAAGTDFKHVIVDLERVSWLNSTGLGWLVGLVRQRKQQQERVALAGVNERIAQLLKVTSLDLVLQRHATVAEAAAALRGGSGGGED